MLDLELLCFSTVVRSIFVLRAQPMVPILQPAKIRPAAATWVIHCIEILHVEPSLPDDSELHFKHENCSNRNARRPVNICRIADHHETGPFSM